ncbi:unnamed protein product [Penicillium salamii]|nr:unnamed protein product [Penicillium salamii]CAG8157927.1 unnamed protein product [Penicillium salamii]CAG8380466.1 unnamed protein product [Penicillium salamii]
MSTFSYAQAAKGTSGTPVQAKTPSEPEKTETPVVEQTNTEPTTETVSAPVEAEAPQKSEPAVEEKDDDFTTVTNKHAAKSKALNSRTSSPNVRPGSKSRKTKEDDSSNTANGTADATEKQISTDGQTEKAEGAEKSTEKSEDAEKDTPPKELKAAPLPSVNIWQQRREAQDLKVKVVPKSTATGKASKAASNADESQQDSSKATKKKGTDGAAEGTKDRKKTEGGKARDAVPSVEDSTAWPTPQVAIVEEKKKTQEKTDKSPVIRPHGKEKWTPVPYVPTAVFNTPLPSAGGGGGGRGGRRATRGGRDGGRGAHGNGAAGVDKATAGQAAQGAKQASGERGRQESGTGRAASLPAQSRRSTSTEAGAAADARKATQATERGRGPRSGDENANGKQVNGGENVPRAQREGKAFGRNQDPRQKGGNLAVDSQAAARSNDRRFEAGSKSADPTGFNDFPRERGEFRSERGGRANRGRGGPYSGFGGQNGQFGNPAMANSFGANKSFGFNDRQRTQQHAIPNGSQQPNRMPLRSPSLPNSGNVYGVYPFPGDINTMYGYQAVNPAPMSAMPYQQYMEPYALLNLLSMQLEYYFSVDNMCKDMFLRKQMDSQGFVPLHVLASFKRVKSLTEDFELLRHVARQLRTVEYHTSEDGVDHLRPREKWQQWVLPVDQREPVAQHDGAAPTTKTDENAQINTHTESAINGSAPQFVPNGSAKTSLSSAAPEFMPSTAGSEITNVGYPMDSPLSPEDLPSSSVPFPWDDPNVDINPARGLDSQSEPPFPSDLESTTGSMRYDEEYNPYYASSAAYSMGDSFAQRHHPEPQSWGKSRPFTDTPNYVPNSFDVSRDETFNGRGRSVARRSTFENFQSYESRSSRLAQKFDSDLYNDFRRSALDDLLTRHADHGFNVLMDFYRTSMLGQHCVSNLVLNDMVRLSQEGPDVSTIVLNTVNEALNSGNMKTHNRRKVNKYFNTQHGKTPKEKLSC